MRRRASAGRTVISALAASLLVFPIWVASQQQEQQHYRKSPQESGRTINTQNQRGRPSLYQDQRQLEATEYKHLRDTALNPERSAIASTAAPARNEYAVRAPLPVRGSGQYAGISSPQNARSLQDWEVEDFILLATVDGSIHARDRKTGAPRWELEVDRPVVETTYYPQNRSAGEDAKSEYDFLWIVEPSRDGDIYIYNQRYNGLQKLHMTVKKLAEDLSPYESIDPAVVYNAEKKTKLYTVDAATGSIVKVFGSPGSFGKSYQSCPKPGGLESLDDDDECRMGPTFVMGRTEYTITIQNRDTTEPICTLMYSEWSPNARDTDLHRQYSTTMDQKYVYALHDGSIFGLDYTQMVDRQRAYTQKLSSPVVRVFDVARPSNAEEERDPQLIILQQPAGPIDSEYSYNAFNNQNRIFVNHTEDGGWFAMSESTYPLVTGRAQHARCYDKSWLDSFSAMQPLDISQGHEAFVGVHDISELDAWRGSGLAISGPSTAAEPFDDIETPLSTEMPSLSSGSIIGKSRIIGSAAANVTDIVIILFVIIMITFFQINRKFFGKFLKQNLDLKKVFPAIEQPLTVPSSPIEPHNPWSQEPTSDPVEKVEAADGKESGDETSTTSRRANSLEPPVELPRSRSGSLEEDRGRAQTGTGVRFQEPSPGPGGEEGPTTAQPGKKKARRGVRGGVKHKKKRSNSKHEQADAGEQAVDEAMQDVQELPRDANEKANGAVVPGGVEICGSVIQIGHLKVYTDTILGFGSHGTMVYRGSFGGREVAVKRMLLEFYEIASHEVGLLQESDDHPNVIRYFDKESAGEFLYIALELCPASLQDIVEKAVNYPLLIGKGLNLPDVLKQITLGLQYLHSLKIVHRDIKPQNILVASPKVLPLNPSSTLQPPRILISDFGLCKKLEGDQNSFRATTAHAAGTSGWRAPELLVDSDLTSSPLHPDAANNSAHTGGSTSEPAVVDPQTNRRATRAIDVFSLGCVFYYVLTGGNHPFDRDGLYMREANIVKGLHTLSDLSMLGDYQWEAKDLIGSMLSHNPRSRPDATTILQHPFFWPPEDRLDFLCHVSDGFEFEPREPPSTALLELESYAPEILAEAGGDFLRVLPRDFRDSLGKQRKYNGAKILDLLRALRNKKNHYEDLPESIKDKVGGLPGGYLSFWTRKFPGLLMACQRVVVEVGWEGRDRFKRFYLGGSLISVGK